MQRALTFFGDCGVFSPKSTFLLSHDGRHGRPSPYARNTLCRDDAERLVGGKSRYQVQPHVVNGQHLGFVAILAPG